MLEIQAGVGRNARPGLYSPRVVKPGNCGITLPEVVLAMFVLASALIPIFGLLTQDVKDTDTLVSQAFAIDRARLVLNTLLDEVPFSNLRAGNPAILVGPQAASLALLLFPNGAKAGGGYACEGIATDPRGIHYHIYLRSEPIEDTTPNFTEGEFYFSFFRNPTPEDQPGWATMTAEATVTEVTHNQPSIYQTGGPTNPGAVIPPYRYLAGPANTTLWGPEHDFRTGTRVRVDQRQVVQADADGRFCLMQRLLLQIRWNLAMKEYSRPTTSAGRPQRIHVITYKANLQ
ncbi:MAG: hypothetical protein GX442_11485 [Candidatus Riflebacteria bacterium]|nr:hypothetical protein [Candidatus Riflebacteria bacterium]